MTNSYRKLEGDEVRFVSIQPGAWADPIRCDLVYLPLPNPEVNLVEAWFSGKPLPRLLNKEVPDTRPPGIISSTEDPSEEPTATAPTPGVPPFVALSYAWGNPDHTEELLLDSQPVQKTVNLIAGLRQLRALLGDPSRARGIFRNSSNLFWIDALSINQADNAEKSAQVPRMGAIFGAAELVVAWLGENGEDDSDIQQLMSLINTTNPEKRARSVDYYCRIITELDGASLHRVAQAYSTIGRRAWFARIWVVQEVVMSQCTIILSGPYWCYYTIFVSAIIAIDNVHSQQALIHGTFRWRYRAMNYASITVVLCEMIQAIFRRRSASESDTPPTTSQREEDQTSDRRPHGSKNSVGRSCGASIFSDWADHTRDSSETSAIAKEFLSTRLLAFVLKAALMTMGSGFRATIPHDYLYGILSLSGNMAYPQNLAPDYALSYEHVFHEYTRLILEHTGDLRIIPGNRRELRGVPSWVPDFRYVRAFFSDTDRANIPHLSVHHDVNISDDGRVCFTRGVHLGEVMLALNCSRSDRSEEQCANTIKCFDDFLGCVCQREQLDKRDVLGKVLELFTVNSYLTAFPASEIQKIYDQCISGSLSMGNQRVPSYRKILIILSDIIAGSSCFVASPGLIYILWNDDEQCKKADVLVVLKGARRPWLLRPVVGSDPEEYTFVGGCQVLYRNVQSRKPWDWDDKDRSEAEEAEKHFFACSEVREFRLV
jgi:hypothetical protein